MLPREATMGVQGWQLSISTGSYRTPNMCSSCLGPRETQVEAVVSEKNGNIRTTLRMEFPYCNACGARATRDKRRNAVVLVVSALLGAILSLGMGVALGGGVVDPVVAFSAGVLAAMLLAAGLAFATRPSVPPPPATARGEAVILKDTSGIVLCTNQRFAELLGEANGATPAPGRTVMSTEIWAPLAAFLVGVLAVLLWARVDPYAFRSRPAPRATTPAPSPARPAAHPKH
jgi:hypothetical protein